MAYQGSSFLVQVRCLSASKGAEKTTGGDFSEDRGQGCHGLPQSEGDTTVTWFWVDTDFWNALAVLGVLALVGAKEDKTD
jgi:hypothetical protein